ncbi:phosphate/phosphite/phosphonate ABC transporter substrate-binding protein [Reyranella aquatilis]|uniref:Phosphate/phosphite/phosphonate ABC transporter substrate-binding protein n=2 Tax=Reyranella aquatilis TaxID=2035356 RepID=A0ABS8KMR5_9HYPH|nr:phosphate/phosphite/phosphonate ABC transporter substrate-binding protein [Reyranella aquatilis]
MDDAAPSFSVRKGQRMNIRSIAAALLLSMACLAAARPAWAQAFQVGVLPNLSPRVLLTNYRPLRDYLSDALGIPVEIATAPDFKTFQARSVAGEYDLVVTAANLGRIAQQDAGLKLIAGFEPAIPALLVTLKAAPATSIEALRGKALAVSNPQSMLVLLGKNWLRQRGLSAGTDYEVVWTRNEDSLAQVLTSGSAPLAMMSAGELRAIRPEIAERLAVMDEFAKLPNFLLLQGRAMTAERAAALTAALMAFPATDLGREFTTLTGVRAIRPVPEKDLEIIDSVTAETREQLR